MQTRFPWTAAVLICALPATGLTADRAISERRPATANGSVEVINVAGAVTVSGWDKLEVEVTGAIGERVERVEVSSAGNHTTVRVVLPSNNRLGRSGEARLAIRVPQSSSLEASLVSSDLRIGGVQGSQRLQTVSGDITTDAGADLQANSVSGDLHLTARNARSVTVKTISGDATLNGASGEVQLSTVSGDVRLDLGTVSKATISSISGDIQLKGALTANGRMDAESVSGDLDFELRGQPGADFELESLSGDIDNCFGPKTAGARFRPGSSLKFRHGDGRGRVRIQTRSGNIRLCNQS